MKLSSALGIGLMLMVLLVGCSKPENAIVGKWKSTERYARTIEFFKDGTLSANGFGGRYSFPDDKHLTLGMGTGSMFSKIYSFKIEGDTLTLVDPMDGTVKPVTEELHRVKE